MDVMAGSASSECQQHENEGSRDDNESRRETATAAIRDSAPVHSSASGKA